MRIVESVKSAFQAFRKFKKTSKVYRAASYLLVGTICVYGLIIVFPNLLFANHTSHNNFDVYTNQDVSGLKSRLVEAEKRLLKSPYYDKNNKHRIYVSGSHLIHRFTTLSPVAFANTDPITRNIRVNKSDFSKDEVYRPAQSRVSRSFSGVVAHEVMHNQLRQSLGLVAYLQVPRWKNEGYCDFVAQESTVDLADGIRNWGLSNKSPSQAYFEYRQMVRFLLERKRVTPRELFMREFDETKVRKETLAFLTRFETTQGETE